ncbi:MAG: Na/Pi cotransporter family protein [Victivallaceae bacterium]|nr:Na/Pi cotransporter family protein [Victivallaceae bacterium]
MDLFKMFCSLLGGLGLFLYGMNTLSQSLQTLGSGFIKRAINYITANRILACLVGVIVTFLVQSSSVSTVMMSSFVNAGLMTLTQGVGFIFGANIGTTSTAWLLTLQVSKYGLLLIGIGSIPLLFVKKPTLKLVGRVLFAVGLIFFGLQWMSEAFKPLRESPEFLHFMTFFTGDSILSLAGCMMLGCVATMVVQASAATLAITMSLAATGAISYETAVGLVLGENIGTTITLWLASLSGGRVTKQVALAHTMFNVTGCVIVLFIFRWYIEFINMMVFTGDARYHDAENYYPNVGVHIAMAHTLFNVCMTIFFLPLLQYLVKFVRWLLPDETPESHAQALEFFSNLPNFSAVLVIKQGQLVIMHMQEIVAESVRLAGEVLCSPCLEREKMERIIEIEEVCDEIQKEIMLYLDKVMQQEISAKDTQTLKTLIVCSDELESISDYAASIVKYRMRLEENNIKLKEESRELISEIVRLIVEFTAEIKDWLNSAEAIELAPIAARYRILTSLANDVRNKHLEMVQKKQYPPLFALTFSDIMVSLRRIKNHAMNVAEALAGGIANF